MKADIHPDYVETTVHCSCGNSFTTRSTARNGVIHAEVCSQCHPFYTGKQKILDSGGRVARFEARYGKRTPGKGTTVTVRLPTTVPAGEPAGKTRVPVGVEIPRPASGRLG